MEKNQHWIYGLNHRTEKLSTLHYTTHHKATLHFTKLHYPTLGCTPLPCTRLASTWSDHNTISQSTVESQYFTEPLSHQATLILPSTPALSNLSRLVHLALSLQDILVLGSPLPTCSLVHQLARSNQNTSQPCTLTLSNTTPHPLHHPAPCTLLLV